MNAPSEPSDPDQPAPTRRTLRVEVSEEMFVALCAEADRKNLSVPTYLNASLRRVLRKDTGKDPGS